MALTNFTISGTTYQAYASTAEADAFLRPDSARWSAWSALDSQAKELRLIEATRLVDAAGRYTGSKVDDNQPLAFPRDDILCNGEAISETLPLQVVEATILLGGSIATNPSLIALTTQTQGSVGGIKKLQSGEDSVEYFQATSGQATATTDVSNLLVPDETANDLLRCFIGGGGSSTGIEGSRATGTTGKSQFAERDRYGLTW